MAVKIVRSAQASWSGTVPDGGGRLALGSGAFEGPFTLRARVEDGSRRREPRGADRPRPRRLLHDVARRPAEHGGPSARRSARRRRAFTSSRPTAAGRSRASSSTPSGSSRAWTRRPSSASRSRRRRPARCRARSPAPRSRCMPSWRPTSARAGEKRYGRKQTQEEGGTCCTQHPTRSRSAAPCAPDERNRPSLRRGARAPRRQRRDRRARGARLRATAASSSRCARCAPSTATASRARRAPPMSCCSPSAAAAC